MSDDQELTTDERRSLDAWTPLTPSPGFADRVLAARQQPARRRRWPLVAGVATCLAAAAIAIVLVRSPSQPSAGSLTATTRTTADLGARGKAVAEAHAELRWHIGRDGAASIDQTAGDVFYRVDPGGPFVVHTPAGDVRVTGTCFRIEVPTMNKKHILLSGTVGAAIAAAVIVTVYEGHVIADTKTGRTELVAGARATIGPDGKTVVDNANPATAAAMSGAIVDPNASREQLIARATQQQLEIGQLKSHIAALEKSGHTATGGGARAGGEPDDGNPWYDPTPETLKRWADECRIRVDEPDLSSFTAIPEGAGNARNGVKIKPEEVGPYNAAMIEVRDQWVKLVRALYIEATGDSAGVDTLSIEAMRREIEQKSSEADGVLMQQLARERAGLAPVPTDASNMSPVERMMRAYMSLGDKAEAALAKRLGPERAREIRTPQGWSSRTEMAGCPVK
ncbi:MAG: hypothetical protein AB7O24_19780 [Kofleriaceae bacterium]